VFEFEIRKLNAECGCMITTKSVNVSFERIVSGQFSPLTAPLPLTRPPAPAPAPAPLRSAYMLCQTPRECSRNIALAIVTDSVVRGQWAEKGR